MLSVRIRQTGLQELAVGLSRIDGAVRDLSPAFRDVVDALRVNEAYAFASEGSLTQGGRWEPLSPEYEKWKSKAAPGERILSLTGALRDSLTGETAGSIVRIGKTAMEYGTSVPYAIFHQEGTSVMPRRAFLNLTDRQAATVGSLIHRYIVAESAKGFRSRSGSYVGA